MEYKNIATSTEEGIGTLTLNRPPLNVLNIEMMEEINSALDRFIGAPVLKALVIRAEGKSFSAGVDVGEHTGELCERMIEVFHGMFRRMDEVEAPIIALVHGAALGGGCELATYCDIVLASERAKFGQPEIQVGVFPPIAALKFPELVPVKKALELILTGDVIRAGEAEEIGLVNRVYSPDEFEEETEKFIDKLRGLSAPVVRLTKKAIYAGVRGEKRALEEIEEIYLGELMETEDANEGLKAFLEKRKPVWKDK